MYSCLAINVYREHTTCTFCIKDRININSTIYSKNINLPQGGNKANIL